ncbi:MAG: monovalent cation/H+ antiporter subunit D family protein [Thermodesulfobacteriota bacterium]
MIQNQLPILIIAIPLFCAFFISLSMGKNKTGVYLLLITAMFGSFIASCMTLLQVINSNSPIHYHLGGWQPPFGIELVIDHLSGMVLVLISTIALLTAIYSFHPVRKDISDRAHHYYALFCLLISGLLGMTATGDAFNLYVLLEISALASYALLASSVLAASRGLAYFATFKYLIMGTIGACFYLLGVGYLYIKTGSLNMADLSGLLNSDILLQSVTIKVGFILMIIGVWIKMAFFPLHGWLPNAYSYASTTTSSLIAPLMTKVSVYIMIRLMFSIFSVEYVFHTLPYHQVVIWMACAAIIFGSVSALSQHNLKRMLCYIIVAEVGYMVGGVWLANESGLTGAVYHIFADGMMTLCLFMAAGAFIFKTDRESIHEMTNIFRRMPVTAVVFLVGGFSIIGIPPTCGFFSKWYLITGAIEGGQWLFVASLLFSSLINCIILFRIIEIGYFPKFDSERSTSNEKAVKTNEVPLTMLVPMVITACSLIVIGLYTNEIISVLIRWTIPAGL